MDLELGSIEMIYPSDPSNVASSSRSTSPPHRTPIVHVLDDDLPDDHYPLRLTSNTNGKPASTSNGVADPAPAKEKNPKSSSSVPKPASTAPGVKPKSTKSAAPRSPSPSPPPPARPPLQTVRLEIKLGGPEDYEIDIASLSKTSGQRPPTPVPPAKREPDTSDDSHSEGDDEGEGDKKKKRKTKKKNVGSEYYDTNDPFIDDSELAQDERTFFAQTKQKGFYVSSGQVALMNKTPKKPKSKKVNILAPSASVSAALSSASLPPLPTSLSLPSTSTKFPASSTTTTKLENGTRDSPIALYSDADDERNGHGVKRKSSVVNDAVSTDGSQKKRRKNVEIQPFLPELEDAFATLREAIDKEKWDVKGKFPPALKPLLGQVALKAIILGQYDDNFFNLMPRLFPYNKFTMTKLIKRTIWREHTNLLLERQNAIIKELKELADEGFPKAQEEWEKSVVAWERRQDRAKAEAETATADPAHSVEGTPAASDSQPTPKIQQSALVHRQSLDGEGNETGQEHDDAGGAPGGKGKDKDKEPHSPAKKYRLTDTMKGLMWQLVCLSNECCRIENEKNTLEGSNQVVSDQGVRKNLYQKIVAAFPEGWLSSGQISREVSVMKKKYEKEIMENDT